MYGGLVGPHLIVTLTVISSSLARSVVFQYLAVLSVTILYYDYLLTLGDEFARYWTRPVTLPAVLFFANRYIALPAHLPILAQLFFDIPPRVASRHCPLPIYFFMPLTSPSIIVVRITNVVCRCGGVDGGNTGQV